MPPRNTIAPSDQDLPFCYFISANPYLPTLTTETSKIVTGSSICLSPGIVHTQQADTKVEPPCLRCVQGSATIFIIYTHVPTIEYACIPCSYEYVGRPCCIE